MKQILLSVLVLVGLNSHAQYFQHLYGDNERLQYLTDGHNAYSGGTTGHFLIGLGGRTFNGDFTFNVQRTDMNGNIGAPFTFNNQYAPTYIVNPPSSPANMHVNRVHSVEFSNGSGFAIAGSYISNGGANMGIFYTHLDPNGNVVVSNGYMQNIFGVTYSYVSVQEITESVQNPGELYITGYFRNAATGNNRVFVMKINQGGALLWGATYDLTGNAATDSDIPYDIVESNYINPGCGCAEVIVVGEHSNGTAAGGVGLPDGFVLRVGAFFGAPLQPADFYGTPNTRDVFTAVEKTTNPNIDAGGNGFAISGYTDMNNNRSMDMWFVALDNTGAMIWDHLFDYNTASARINEDYSMDIMERINTLGNYEYYLAGYTLDVGNLGAVDEMVIKTDDFGNGVAAGQFSYGDIRNDWGMRIDKLNGYGPDGDGIAVFGYSEDPNYTLGGYDHLLVKAYFNGVTACHQNLIDPIQSPGYASRVTSSPQEFYPRTFYDYPFLVNLYQPLLDIQICHTTSDPNGSNARMVPVEPKGDKEVIISPNPMVEGAGVAMIQVETESPTDVQVTIYDLLGKQYYKGSFTLAKGNNKLPLDLGKTSMATGMYTVKVSGVGINQNVMLLIK